MESPRFGLKYEKPYGLAKLVQELSGRAVASNRPVVGDALFQIESGIIASWFQNCGQEHPAELFPFRPMWLANRQPAWYSAKAAVSIPSRTG